MYQITRVEPVPGGRGKAKVFLDDASCFILYKKELAAFNIREDGVLSDDAYREITESLLPLRAKKRAMHLLEKRPYTEKTLRDKLADGAYPEAAIDAAIDYVKSYGYIDDLQYAKDHIAYHIEDRNRRRLELDLMKKGIDRAVIDEALAACYADGTDNATSTARRYEMEMIRKELRKKKFDAENTDYETRAKIQASLARKGFDAELVRDVMREVDA